MKRTDHIFALTTSLLKASDTDFNRIHSLAGQIYTLDAPRKSGVVSLGAYEDNSEETFSTWISRLRKETIHHVIVHYQTANTNSNLEPHIAAAFAGHNDFLLQISTSTKTYTYVLDTFFAPRYEISVDQFISLIDSQHDKSMAWAKVAEQILESNRMNNRSDFPADAAAYLKSDEGRHVFDYLVTDLVSELQVECVVMEQPFVMPQSLQSLFTKYESSFLPDDDREYVYLYSLRDVTAAELLELVNAQPFGLATWEKLNLLFIDYNDPLATTTEPIAWSSKLAKLSHEDLGRISHTICRAICELCENNGTKPTIPHSLADAFGPDEMEQKRATARSKSKDQWMLQGNQNPWEYYAFHKINYPLIKASESYTETRQRFISALQQIQQFAASIHSPFEPAFTLSLFILDASIPSGSDSKTQIEWMATQLMKTGISDQAIENLRNAEWVIELGLSMGWSQDRINGLLAIKFADVFGGMGSWNDQYEEMNQEQFQKVSADLFDSMKEYMASVLS